MDSSNKINNIARTALILALIATPFFSAAKVMPVWIGEIFIEDGTITDIRYIESRTMESPAFSEKGSYKLTLFDGTMELASGRFELPETFEMAILTIDGTRSHSETRTGTIHVYLKGTSYSSDEITARVEKDGKTVMEKTVAFVDFALASGDCKQGECYQNDRTSATPVVIGLAVLATLIFFSSLIIYSRHKV